MLIRLFTFDYEAYIYMNDMWRYDLGSGLWYFEAGVPPSESFTSLPYPVPTSNATFNQGPLFRAGSQGSARCLTEMGMYVFGGYSVPVQSSFFASGMKLNLKSRKLTIS